MCTNSNIYCAAAVYATPLELSEGIICWRRVYRDVKCERQNGNVWVLSDRDEPEYLFITRKETIPFNDRTFYLAQKRISTFCVNDFLSARQLCERNPGTSSTHKPWQRGNNNRKGGERALENGKINRLSGWKHTKSFSSVCIHSERLRRYVFVTLLRRVRGRLENGE